MGVFRFTYTDEPLPVSETPLQKAERRQWLYATHDPVACTAIAEKLGQACRRGRTITYAELSRGVSISIPGETTPHVVDIQGGTRISADDQHILDDFLCFLSLQSFKNASILASANVFDPTDKRGASSGFFEAARILGCLPVLHSDIAEMMFWKQELKKVYQWFKLHPI